MKDDKVRNRITFISFGVACLMHCLLLPAVAHAAAGVVHIGQTAVGAADGSSCANARAASWFNTSGNWGTGTTQIGPGTRVQLCGTVSSNLTLQGNGASGSPVVIDGSGAQLSGGVQTNNKSWWRVQNVKWVDGFTGTPIQIVGGSNGVFTGSRADNFAGPNAVFLMQYSGSVRPSQMLISNNYIRTTTANLGDTQHDIIKTEGSTNVVLEGNHLEMRIDGAGPDAHNDIIQTFEKGGTSAGPSRDWTVRYNRFVMNSNEAADRSWTMIEGMSGTLTINGNVFLGIKGAGGANGINLHNNYSGLVVNIFNNTIVANAGASNNIFNLSGSGTAYLRNNIVSTVDQTVFTGSMPVMRDHNLWYGNRSPSCSGVAGEICGQAPGFRNPAAWDFSIGSGSPAATSGSNMGSTYAKAEQGGTVWPAPTLVTRPSTGNWAMGAYAVNDGGASVQAPSGVQVR